MRPHAHSWQPTPPAESPDSVYDFSEIGENTGPERCALATESAIAISYNGINQAVMMVSPWDLEDFVAGFSLGNGIISHIDEIFDIRLKSSHGAWHADVEISSRSFWQLKQQRRQLAGSSGCGLCGVSALEQALPDLKPLAPSALPPAAHLAGLRRRLDEAQLHARRSGALHAAVFVDTQGRMQLCREDIGRHNALDKLIGALLRDQNDPRQGFVVVTSRCGLELLHKAVRAGIGTLVSLSAPTSLTVDWARRHQLNLIHAPQRDAPRVYSPAPTRQ